VQEYSPTEAAKVYEKAATRRQNNPLFNPMHTLRELDPNEQQKTMDHASPEFRWYISQRFCHVSAYGHRARTCRWIVAVSQNAHVAGHI
jgi:hypothetical protein